MKTITVSASKKYDILIGDGLLDDAGPAIRCAAGGNAAGIVSDDNVYALYGERLNITLAENGYRVADYVFPHGEQNKNTETFVSIINFLADERIGRSDIVVALGGGVAGDLAGFAAACYMRGVRFVQIPTTLLAAVDSSVGGKTAVNAAAGKNLAGAFYQPELVLCDTSLLSTLTAEIFADGCAEVIKYGVIFDRELFDSLETPINDRLEDIISKCVAIKRDIVAEDEFENGRRKLLNFGHTVGHALESLSGYTIPHGRAVASGMAVVTRAAAAMGICDTGCVTELTRMLRLYGLPDDAPYAAGNIARACLSDKKRDGSFLTMVFPAAIGECVLKDIPVDELEAVIRSGSGE